MEKYNEFCKNNEADLIIQKTSELHKNKKEALFMIKFAEKGYFLQSERQDQRDHPQFFSIHWQSG